jgi:hypothetical protein
MVLAQSVPKPYFRLRKRASGPESNIVWGLNGVLPPQNPLEKVGGFALHLPVGFAVGGGRLDPINRRFPARKLYCVT